MGKISPLLNKLGRTHHVWIDEVAICALLIANRPLCFRTKEIDIRIYLLLHLEEALHLEVSTVHALRATHDAAYLHSVRICLHLILVLLLGLLQIPLTHHRVRFEILCILLRLERRHIHSILEIVCDSRIAKLSLIVPVLIHHSIGVLPKHVPLPVLICLELGILVYSAQ